MLAPIIDEMEVVTEHAEDRRRLPWIVAPVHPAGRPKACDFFGHLSHRRLQRYYAAAAPRLRANLA